MCGPFPGKVCTPTIKTSEDRDIFEVLNFSEAGADQKMMNGRFTSRGRVRKMVDMLPEDQREAIHPPAIMPTIELLKRSLNSPSAASITALGRRPSSHGLILPGA